MKTKTIEIKVEFNCEPHELFEMIIDEKKHAEFTGSEANISRKVGGIFEVYDGSINGKNIEIEKDKKIVQEWYCETDGWPEGHYSTVTFEFKKTKKGTELKFTQAGVPEEAYEDILSGWEEYYWKPMKTLLKK